MIDARRAMAVLALWIGGCASAGEVGMSGRAAQAAYTMSNYDAAVMLAEREVDKAKDARAEVRARSLAMRGLGKTALLEGTPDAHDAQAGRHFQIALQRAGSDPALVAEVQWSLARYFASTSRLRQGLPHVRKALEAANGAQDTAVQIGALHTLAEMFAQMGELETSDEYVAAAMEVGRAAFPRDDEVAPSLALDAYLEFLDWRLQNAVTRPDPLARVDETWAELEHALAGVWSFADKMRLSPVARETRLVRKVIRYLHGASAYASLGQQGRARELFEQALADLDNFGGSVAIGPLRNRIECTRAEIEFAFGQYDVAAQRADTCIEGALSPRDRVMLQERLLTVLGGIAERNGELDEASRLYEQEVQRYETVRAAVPVPERAAFFRGRARGAWEGLVRVAARKYATQPSDAALVALLQASDGMRARQLQELVGTPTTKPDLAKIRRRLSARDGVLSIAFAGDDVVAALVTKGGADVVTLSGRSATLRQQLAAGVAEVGARGPAAVTAARMAKLGNELLGPFAESMRGLDRITFVADGALQAFPIDLLLVDGRRLAQWATVAMSPSLTSFSDETRGRAPDRIYALGDPTYAPPKTLGYLSAAESATRGSTLLQAFSPLPETRSEVDAIASLFSDDAATIHFDREASESTLRRQPPTQYRYLHFATHGILAGQLPGVAEPALVLAHESGSDGFLTASEVAEVELDADLTVLSACSTGTGESLPGEGVMGMSRAFLVAGSRGVVASLWPVDSAATEALMVAFYRYHRAGLDAARALARAKHDVASQPRWEDPYFWAAFVLVAQGGLLTDTSASADADDPGPAGLAPPDVAQARPKSAPSAERGLTFEAAPEVPRTPAVDLAHDYAVLPPWESTP